MKHFLIVLVKGYQLFVRPFLPPACRFTPSCSEYAIEAVRLHGAVAGSVLAARRIGRCRPGGGHGYDPVPEAKPKLFGKQGKNAK